MATKVGINGFGRIGRNVLRAISESGRTDIEIVAVNDLAPTETLAHLYKYDSVHGIANGEVKVSGDAIDIGNGPIKVLSERDPAHLPWRDLGVDVVLECTGFFTEREKAAAHLTAGANRVLISAPGKDADITVVYGVNHEKIEASHKIVSNASCTTNCLAPVAKIIHELCGIEQGFMTTVHSYTSDQRILDAPHKDLRRARAAAMSLIPTSTGAAKAVGLVLPELAGKLDGTAIRVPSPNVSMIDLTFVPSRETSVEQINSAMERASQQELKGVLEYVTAPLVSIDFNHSPYSSSFDASQTQIVDGRLVRVLSWYDNEWGFSNRMCDTAVVLGKLD
ncbi:glyceraldehyde-3-phosphate dehydrogenase [bacterium MnTg02]|nr:glyceraldehyde-3-phosphate dehydrogenase [bacterium MnTg02]